MDELFENKNVRAMRELVEDTPEADIAEYLETLEPKNALVIMKIMPKDLAADVFSYLEPGFQEEIVGIASDEEIKKLIEELSTDDAVDMLEEMPANLVEKVLKCANASTRAEINRFLNYPEDSVGSIMTSEYASLKAEMTVRQAIEHIRKISFHKETVYTCYVLGSRRSLLGVIELSEILGCRDDDELIENLMETNVVKVGTADERQEAVRLTQKYDLFALPVVDSEDRLVGIVTVDDIVDVIEEEATRDIEQMAAIVPTEDTYLKTSVFSHVKARIPWLFVLMLAGMLNGVILGEYEVAISALPILVTFMPMLTGTGGNSGSQTTATVIRAMTLDEISLKDSFRVMWKEVRVALCIGVVFGILNFARIYFFTSDPDRVKIGLVLGLAMIFTILMAKTLGAFLPLLAKTVKLDPAVVASPMITTIVDVVSLMFYFNLAMQLLSHRM
ncbi:MAG: magnesium transporter [Clostridia bacterium]|nr:magnesium transporter [Clostridia bacterium]